MAESGHSADTGDARRRKQQKKMTKLLAKAWGLSESEPFQESSSSKTNSPLDLTAIGIALDGGAYKHSTSGWEKFATDLGCVYNRHILRKGEHAGKARNHLEEVCRQLSKVDAKLGELAMKSTPPPDHDKKRKQSDKGEVHIPKKKHVANRHSINNTETLTLSQRETKAMEALGIYIEECGGEREQVNSFRCKVSQRPGGRFDTVFFTAEGRRMKSMIDVARFLNLLSANETKDNITASSSAPHKKHNASRNLVNNGRPRNHRECESERKKLRKELDKLIKAHGKATKALDEFRNDNRRDRYPIDDDILIEEKEAKKKSAQNHSNRAIRKPDIDGFPGIPPHCLPDLLLVWDFFCTFGRALSLDPIGLDDFVAALTFSAHHVQETEKSGFENNDQPIPVYIMEAHLALLKMLLQDPVSDEWWWSTLETEELDGDGGDGDIAGKKGAGVTSECDEELIPAMKVDMVALLGKEEDPSVTTRWLQALEDVRIRKTNSGGPIKSAVKSAIAITTNQDVKLYLKRALRKWKGNSAGFTKRAVLWLVNRVREARPDLWGRKVSKQEVDEQVRKVAHEASLAMSQIEEEENDEMNLEDSDEASDWEDEEESDEDDEDYVEEEETSSNGLHRGKSVGGTQKKDDNTPVTSSIPLKPPPTIVDLLLPPSKPLAATELVSPFTWPCLAGATACRVLHRYKRLKNEVDDNLRTFRELPCLSVAERRRREAIAPQRIFSECAALDIDGVNPLEQSINHLCDGKSYHELSPLQRLCILRLLVEAGYDTHRVNQCVEDNFKARINAGKALEAEERRAKRVAKEETSAAEAKARERLAAEAKATFFNRKRREIARNNKHTGEFTSEYIAGLTDDDIIEFDEDTKAEYESLPTVDGFNRSEVNTMVAKIQEEEAFDTHALLVLTMDEIQAREESTLASMEERLAQYGDVDSVYQVHTDRETSAKIDKLRREISTFEQATLSLPHMRAAAVESLKDAIEDGTVKALRAAIKSAKLAKLTGIDDDTDGVWALDLLRDAALELKTAERRKRVTEAHKDLIAKRNKCFIRTDPLGQDRYRNNFWHFDNDESGRVWVESDYVLKDCSCDETTSIDLCVDTNLVIGKKTASIGACDEVKDLLYDELELSMNNDQKEVFLQFCNQEYHSSSMVSTLVRQHWGCHVTDQSLRVLVKNLSGRGVREGQLKTALKEILEASGLSAAPSESSQQNANEQQSRPESSIMGSTAQHHDNQDGRSDNSEYQIDGDKDAFQQAKALAESKLDNTGSTVDTSLIVNISSAIGMRVRLRIVPDPVTAPKSVNYEMGTVLGWKTRRRQSQSIDSEQDTSEGVAGIDAQKEPVWRLALDKGGDMDLSCTDLIHGLTCMIKWKTQYKGYIEDDAPFLAYRNSMGRFCGRASDAPTSCSPSSFAKLLLKREQEHYMHLKNRSYENNWGGKSGARNAWMASIKEYGYDQKVIRDGLLTLEDAFFELSGGFKDDLDTQSDTGGTSCPNGRDLLNDENTRFDIELESLGTDIQALWNSRGTRAIFREIVECKYTGLRIVHSFKIILRFSHCSLYILTN
uniref:DDT domain-containing protein n=1 Tax=Ditylum brightwellii TaxID=49249 RepID=A0A7S4VAH9_9STRA